jgi:hypothetical protein
MPQEKKPQASGDDDEPSVQRVKQTTFLRCTAAHAAFRGTKQVAGEGEEIAIVTVEAGGEIEPLMFTVKDVKQLVKHLVVVLAHFQDEEAKEIYMRYFADCQP